MAGRSRTPGPRRGAPRQTRGVRRPLLALIVLVAVVVVGYVVRAVDDGPSPRSSGTSTPGTSTPGTSTRGTDTAGVTRGETALSALPAQAAQTYRLVRADGPFPYPSDDGVTFHNFEHVLPAEPDGFYREYTVPTPGSDDRGTRRLVVGRDGSVYYTGDHYETFARVDVTG